MKFSEAIAVADRIAGIDSRDKFDAFNIDLAESNLVQGENLLPHTMGDYNLKLPLIVPKKEEKKKDKSRQTEDTMGPDMILPELGKVAERKTLSRLNLLSKFYEVEEGKEESRTYLGTYTDENGSQVKAYKYEDERRTPFQTDLAESLASFDNPLIKTFAAISEE